MEKITEGNWMGQQHEINQAKLLEEIELIESLDLTTKQVIEVHDELKEVFYTKERKLRFKELEAQRQEWVRLSNESIKRIISKGMVRR